ncbi:hypothetical protein [Bosea minatitlanensis]|uniref:Uncharacterized protein n=1 Tax=Bosea minatitlanensis TaxID=128782 RepID=A0ABW0F1B9_9HYPH|nr:hypothetical protein [Bosea minatitlanensis]
MADVIPFALWRRHRPRFCAFPQETAEILFFTGVRYERAAEPAAERSVRAAAEPAAASRGRRPAPGKAAGRRKARRPA